MRTTEIDEDYNDSGVDWASYEENLSESPKEANFILDRKIEAERARRAEIYRCRLEEGLEIFSCQTLNLSDFLEVRGLSAFLDEDKVIERLDSKDRRLYEIQRTGV